MIVGASAIVKRFMQTAYYTSHSYAITYDAMYNSEATLYPPDDAVKNLIRMSAYMDKKLGSISANRVVDFAILDELGTKRNQRVQK
jgi:hypothetical protein